MKRHQCASPYCLSTIPHSSLRQAADQSGWIVAHGRRAFTGGVARGGHGGHGVQPCREWPDLLADEGGSCSHQLPTVDGTITWIRQSTAAYRTLHDTQRGRTVGDCCAQRGQARHVLEVIALPRDRQRHERRHHHERGQSQGRTQPPLACGSGSIRRSGRRTTARRAPCRHAGPW